MYTNRMFFALVVLALAAVIFFTLREAVSTAAIAQADRAYDQVELARSSRQVSNVQPYGSYEQIEAVRLNRSVVLADESYSQIETLRSQRGAAIADRSYDAIENLRAARGTK